MKDTSKIVEELRLCEDFTTFYNDNKDYMVQTTLSEMLNKFIQEKGLHKSVIINNSGISEIYAYQIFSGVRTPDRKKLLALAIALGLNFHEIQTLLKCSNYPPLYIKIPFDAVIIYGMYNKLSLSEINEMLFEYGLKTLG